MQVSATSRRTSQRMHRAAALPRARVVPRLPRVAVWVLAVLALLGAGLLWLRDSSLVAVQKVTVTGLTGPEAARVTERLTAAAQDMTTLHVRDDQLRAVVQPFPVVKSVTAQSRLPAHAADHRHRERPRRGRARRRRPDPRGRRRPAAARGRPALVAGRADARHPGRRPRRRPRPRCRRSRSWPPRRARCASARRSRAPRARAASPSPCERARSCASARRTAWRPSGRPRPPCWPTRRSAGARYLDLRYPERPAAGGLEDPATQRDPRAVNAASSTAPTTPVTPSAGAAAPTTP